MFTFYESALACSSSTGVFCRSSDSKYTINYPTAGEPELSLTLCQSDPKPSTIILDTWWRNDNPFDSTVVFSNRESVSDTCMNGRLYLKRNVKVSVKLKNKILFQDKLFQCESDIYIGCYPDGEDYEY